MVHVLVEAGLLVYAIKPRASQHWRKCVAAGVAEGDAIAFAFACAAVLPLPVAFALAFNAGGSEAEGSVKSERAITGTGFQQTG